ncbi:MAG TPA: cytochrome b/b6 domain-containing protein [Burkholderiaceae bacterium]|nr:cytochrome b/b6 domain-containing protein [Burkholderiaceae bacterium]
MTDVSDRIRVWDLPTRVFHMALALTVIGSIASAKIGGNAMVWHIRLGLLAMALLVFRLVWGFVGGYWCRFATFLYRPAAIADYLRGGRGPGGHYAVGHSPLGALSVFALLGVLALQVATGLVADDEVATTGPLNRFVSSAVALKATAWHETGGQWSVLLLIAAHVGAVFYYQHRKRIDLIRPMLDGDKPGLPPSTRASADGTRERLLALSLALAAAGAAWWVGRLGG